MNVGILLKIFLYGLREFNLLYLAYLDFTFLRIFIKH